MRRLAPRRLELGHLLLGALLVWGLFAQSVGCSTTVPKNTTVIKVNGSDPNGAPPTNGYRQLVTDRWGPFNGPGGETGAAQRSTDRQAVAAQETGGTPSPLTEQERKELLYGDIAPLQVLYKDPGLADVTLDYQVGTYLFTVPLMDGLPVLTNDSGTAWLGEYDERIRLRAHLGATTVPSDSFTSAIVLTGSQNLERLAAARGLLDAGPPRGLAPGLSAYIDSVTCVGTLSANHALVFFELDETDPLSAEYDFQDLVLFVDFTIPTQTTATGLPPLGTGDDFLCGPPPQPFVRDSIGGDSTATDGNGCVYNQYWPLDGIYGISTFAVPSGFAGDFSYLDAVIGSGIGNCTGGTVCLQDKTFELLGWSTQLEAEQNPLVGTLFNIDVTSALSVTSEFFGTGTAGGATSFPTSLIHFDLTGLAASCPAGGCVFGLLVDHTNSSDLFGICLSDISGPQDINYCDACPPAGVPLSQPSGVRFSVQP